MYKLSILVISRTYTLMNSLLKSISYATEIDRSDLEILCSWNGCLEDINYIERQKFPNLDIFINVPYHFSSNMNFLLDKVKGDFILLINDDVYLDPGSIDKAVESFNKLCNIGLIGGNLRDRNGFLTHSGIIFNIFHLPYHIYQGLIKFDNQFITSKSYNISAVTGALMLTTSKVLNNLRFNTRYQVCGEDIEFCLDIRDKFNREIFYEYQFSGIHEAETTRSLFGSQNKSYVDKILICLRYIRFIFCSSIENLFREYKYNQIVHITYKKYKIDKFKSNKNKKWILTHYLFLQYLRFVLFIRKLSFRIII